MQTQAEELLLEQLKQLQQAESWLRQSYEQCEFVQHKQDFDSGEYDKLEDLTARFARLSDFSIAKGLSCAELMGDCSFRHVD